MIDFSTEWLRCWCQSIQPQFEAVVFQIDFIDSTESCRIGLDIARELAKWPGSKSWTAMKVTEEVLDSDWEDDDEGEYFCPAGEHQCSFVQGLKQLSEERRIELVVEEPLATSLEVAKADDGVL